MTKIIVLTADNNQVGITVSDGVTPQQALAVCAAAIRHFQELAMELEVQRRLEEKSNENMASESVE